MQPEVELQKAMDPTNMHIPQSKLGEELNVLKKQLDGGSTKPALHIDHE